MENLAELPGRSRPGSDGLLLAATGLMGGGLSHSGRPPNFCRPAWATAEATGPKEVETIEERANMGLPCTWSEAGVASSCRPLDQLDHISLGQLFWPRQEPKGVAYLAIYQASGIARGLYMFPHPLEPRHHVGDEGKVARFLSIRCVPAAASSP
jgi:hypothetical protein